MTRAAKKRILRICDFVFLLCFTGFSIVRNDKDATDIYQIVCSNNVISSVSAFPSVFPPQSILKAGMLFFPNPGRAARWRLEVELELLSFPTLTIIGIY